ncbi:hypothetical protein SAMN05192583_3492 [Sphingomonas gellani]|uniref:Uncharacterized protein n=1 Tax=Sphingomonas gellani TaxID=1166340 RepID=A0A1H8J7F0_9SPHN|nr:hypothetical protein [Sphingomonas gellani]SEN76018.1 hypothetical protein SAMN05192583_3492 [Sphingomonas gellani]
MSRVGFHQIVEGIDRHLPYLHKERWAIELAELREAARNAVGHDRERAKQAVLDHYKTEFRPETSRAVLIEQARQNYDTPPAENADPA